MEGLNPENEKKNIYVCTRCRRPSKEIKSRCGHCRKPNIICPVCGQRVSFDAKECKCGAKFKEPWILWEIKENYPWVWIISLCPGCKAHLPPETHKCSEDECDCDDWPITIFLNADTIEQLKEGFY